MIEWQVNLHFIYNSGGQIYLLSLLLGCPRPQKYFSPATILEKNLDSFWYL